jgi:hypothetical protein
MLLHTGKRMIARQSRGVAVGGVRTGGTGTRGARRLHAGKRMIAGKSRGVGSGGDLCAHSARRLHAGKRMIAGNGRGIARTVFRTLTCRRVTARCAASATYMMALRLDRGNRRTRMRGDDAGTVQLRACGVAATVG